MTTVYYDGLCRLCSREISHYRKQRGSEGLRFVDITLPAFDARSEGVDPVSVHKVMHVRRSNGELATGVDAFIEIWKVLPKYNWAAKLAVRPLPSLALKAFYEVFTTVRPYLPRKKSDCAASPYCETR